MEIKRILVSLEKRGYTAKYFENSSECADYLNKEIDQTSVGMGGSVSIKEMGLYDSLKAHNRVVWHNDAEAVEKYGSKQLRDMAIDTEIYISSVNGMSEDGVIVNIDYTGNRIGAMCYGHKKVYLIVGINKLARDFEAALWRARNIASPKNAMRLGRKTPCAIKGDKCYDCQSSQRICNGFLVFDRAMAGCETEVIIVNESLGY